LNYSVKEVRALEIREMPLEEKYSKLLDDYVLLMVRNIALHKELGTLDKSRDLAVKVQKKMLPGFLGPSFKLLKAIAPGKTFGKLIEQTAYNTQIWVPLSSMELSRVSDREAIARIKNCPILQRGKELVKKTGLNVDPKELCEGCAGITKEITKEFGVDATWEFTENGCTLTEKLK
jgi:hypothetical protein